MVDLHDSDFVISCYKEIPYVSNTINKLHIMSGLNFGYIHNLYHDKQVIIDDMFCQYIKPVLKYSYNPALIQ